MKTQLIPTLVALLLGTGGAGALAADATQPELVPVIPEHVFIPQGFDNNDNAQVVLSGSFPSTCYRAGPAKAQVDARRKRIIVHSEAYYYPEAVCLRILVPYTITVDVGVLQAGSYRVMMEREDGDLVTRGEFPVAVSANSGPDDELYALVQEARLGPPTDESLRTGKRELTISGTMTSSCLHIREVKTVYRDNNVLEVLPIAHMDGNNPACATVMTPFEEKLVIDAPWNGDALVHIRSMNGQALNKVFLF